MLISSVPKEALPRFSRLPSSLASAEEALRVPSFTAEVEAETVNPDFASNDPLLSSVLPSLISIFSQEEAPEL